MAYIGTQPKDIRSFGKAKFDFTATQDQTAFTGLDDDGKTLGFTTGQITVYLNGILLDESDYTASGSNTVTLASAANAGDILSVVALQTDIPNSDYVPATGGTFSGAVVANDGLTVDLPTDGDILELKGTTTQLVYQKYDTTNYLWNMENELLFGTYADKDLRIGTNGGEKVRVTKEGNVGIGTATPSQYSGVAGTKVLAVGTTTGNNGVNVVSGSTSTGSYTFSDSGGNDRGGLIYYHTADLMTVSTAGTEAMRINASGQVGIGTDPWAALTVPSPTYISGVYKKTKAWGSLSTTGEVIARLYSAGNGQSAWLKFHLVWGGGGYREITYACYNGAGTWYPIKKDVYASSSSLDVESSGNGSTVLFTIKGVGGSASYTPRVIVEAYGNGVDSNYFL